MKVAQLCPIFTTPYSPWHSPGHNTGVGESESEVTQPCPTLCDPWTVAHQAPLSMEFSRLEYWSGLPFPSPGNLPDPGIKPRSPALQADSLPSEPLGKPTWSKYLDASYYYGKSVGTGVQQNWILNPALPLFAVWPQVNHLPALNPSLCIYKLELILLILRVVVRFVGSVKKLPTAWKRADMQLP